MDSNWCFLPPIVLVATFIFTFILLWTLQGHHNERNRVSNHRRLYCLLNRLFRRKSKKKIKAPRHWPLWREFTVDGEFPEQVSSNAESVSIWWRDHVTLVSSPWMLILLALVETVLTSSACFLSVSVNHGSTSNSQFFTAEDCRR